jgi:hypothetical protein
MCDSETLLTQKVKIEKKLPFGWPTSWSHVLGCIKNETQQYVMRNPFRMHFNQAQ